MNSRNKQTTPLADDLGGVKVEMLDPPLNPQLPPEVAPMRARQARRTDTLRAGPYTHTPQPTSDRG